MAGKDLSHSDRTCARPILRRAVLHARAQQLDEAKELLAEALQQGGEEARALAAGFPVLAPLLAK